MNEHEKSNMYRFLFEEMEFQFKHQKRLAILLGFAGGVIGFCVCWIFVACTMNHEPVASTIEPRQAICSEGVRI